MGWITLLVTLLAPSAHAVTVPAGASLFPPLQVPWRGASIVGARLNLFLGVHESVAGLDLGVVGNMTDRSFGGLQIAGLFNRNKGPSTFYFAQLAGISNFNLNGADVYGLQLAGAMNMNHGRSTVIGLAIAPGGNYMAQTMVGGAQIGLVNRAKEVFGVQIGLVNICEAVHGVQIGLVNVNRNGPLPVLPVVNFGF